jgi:CheY-like chemotaxis protein
MRTGLLIADADADLRRIYDRMSSILGFHVETAADGLECWTKLRARIPDALVVDVEIPWGGGEGVLVRLREDSIGAKAPAIFVTGEERPEDLSRRFGIPLGRCFQKPIQLTRLLDSVCAAIAAGGA